MKIERAQEHAAAFLVEDTDQDSGTGPCKIIIEPTQG
jgi:hypothetical protein